MSRSSAVVGVVGVTIASGVFASPSAFAADECTVKIGVLADLESALEAPDEQTAGHLTWQDGDQICISGTFALERKIHIGRPLTLRGVGLGPAIIQPSETAPVDELLRTAYPLTVESVTFDGKTLPGLQAISAETNAPLTLSGSTFKDFRAGAKIGGAIYAVQDVTISGGSLFQNNQSGSGGAVYSAGFVTVAGGSTFRDNSATSGGGAITAVYGVGISESTFTGNTSLDPENGTYGEGGAILSSKSVSVASSTFTSNSARFGGAIHAGDIIVNGESAFSLNSASVHGGAVFSGGLVDISDSVFSDNTTLFDGGAIYSTGSQPVAVDSSSFEGNVAELGGAIYVDDEVESTVSNSVFSTNRAVGELGAGGGIFGQGGWLFVSSSTFSGNTATWDGGAIKIFSVDAVNSTFFENTADHEGGAVFAQAGRVLFSTFLYNTAPEPQIDEDIPGNSIYKVGNDPFFVGGNIFAGTNLFPELGVGEVITSPFQDLGGNMFSTPAADEEDLDSTGPGYDEATLEYNASSFGNSITGIFGRSNPVLQSNGGPTPTVALASNALAIDFVDVTSDFPPVFRPDSAEPVDVLVDQRGVTRTAKYDAGAFEFDVELDSGQDDSHSDAGDSPSSLKRDSARQLAATGNQALSLMSGAAAALVALGAGMVVWSRRSYRRGA